MNYNFVIKTLLIYFENELINEVKLEKDGILIYLENSKMVKVEITED